MIAQNEEAVLDALLKRAGCASDGRRQWRDGDATITVHRPAGAQSYILVSREGSEVRCGNTAALLAELGW